MRLRVLTLPICAVLALSACSGGSSASDTSATDSSTTATSATQDTTTSADTMSSADTAESISTATATAGESTDIASLPASDTAAPNTADLTTSTADVAEDPTERVKPGISVPTTAPTELVITDLIDGTGTEAAVNSTITFNYVVALQTDGTIVDSSYDRSSPVTVELGINQVIPGVDEGLIGVKEGGRRQLDIPPDLAYGATGSGPIPPSTPISFVIDVVAVSDPPPPPTVPEQADAADCPAVDGSSPKTASFAEYPPFCIDVNAKYTATIVTNKGDVTVELFADKAPLTVNNFVVLSRYHFYDGLSCHRIIPSFVAQCGDPEGTGFGGPGYEFADELPGVGEYTIGSLAMANSGPGTNGSQFFIITGDDGAQLPPSYSLFGQIIEGLDTTVPALDKAANPNPEDNGSPPLEEVTIEKITIEESGG